MLYFFYGNENLLDLELQKRKEDLLQKGYRIHIFDFSWKEEELFLNELSMNSMFLEKKAFLLKRTEKLKSAQLQSLLKAIALFDISEKEILISFAEKEVGKSIEKELAKIEHQTICLKSEDQKKQLKKYIEEKLSLPSYDAEKLLEMLGNDFHKLEQESDKILQFLDGEKFNFETLVPILSIEKDYNIFFLLDEFLEKETSEKLLEYLQRNPNDSSLFLYQLADTLLLVSKLSSLLDEGLIEENISYTDFKASFTSIQQYCRGRGDRILHPYQVYLKIKVAKKYPVEFWLQKMKEVLFCEYNFKSGFIDISMSLSQFILGFYSFSSNTPQDRQKEYRKEIPKI